MSDKFVAILMGSDSDLPVMEHAAAVLAEYGVKHEVRVLSAHRTPEATREYIQSAEQRGCQVFIAAAGMAAHLAGAVAAHTTRPVIGVPLAASLHGLDALLSTVQMPGGMPVACMAIGKAGAKNAATLAVQMMALQDESLDKKVKDARRAMTEAVLAKNEALVNA